VAKTRITDCAEIRKKKSADADEKNKKVKDFFQKNYGNGLKAKKKWQIRKFKKKAD
jgi:hypothetical protein